MAIPPLGDPEGSAGGVPVVRERCDLGVCEEKLETTRALFVTQYLSA
jgi:hypothetical protein